MRNLLLSLILLVSFHYSSTSQTIKGIKRIADIDSPMNGENSSIEFNRKLYFTSFQNLYVTDGKALGSTLIKSFAKNVTETIWLTKLNGKLLFMSGSQLWTSDGTTAGTVAITGVTLQDQWQNRDGYHLRELNGFAYFYGDDGTHGIELWKTDGTQQGTTMVKDINTQPGQGILSGAEGKSIAQYKNNVYFAGTDGIHGNELWVSDGTAAGTKLFEDILEGPFGSNATAVNIGPYFLVFATDTSGLPTGHSSANIYTMGSNDKLVLVSDSVNGVTLADYTILNGIIYTTRMASGTTYLVKINVPQQQD